MSEIKRITNPEKIKQILELSCKYKLDMTFQHQEESHNSYFLNIDNDKNLAICRKAKWDFAEDVFTKEKPLALRFKFVENGKIAEYEFPFQFVRFDTYKYFSAIIGKFPDQLAQVTELMRYELVPEEKRPIFLGFLLKDEPYREEIVRISISELQFYAKSRDLRTQKRLWIGRRLEESQIKLPGGSVSIDMQLSKNEGGGWVSRFLAPQPAELEELRKFVTEEFFKLSLKSKFELANPFELLKAKQRLQAKKPKILIFDKDAETILALKESLDSGEYEVSVTSEPEQALRLARSEKPALLFLEVSSPKSSGMQIFRELKENYYTKNIPVIFMSAYFEEKDLPVIRQFGAKDVLLKPFELNDFLEKVNSILHPEKNVAAQKAPRAVDSQSQGDAGKPRVLLANNNDEDTIFKVFDWAREHQFKVVVVEALNEFLKEAITGEPVCAIVNLQKTHHRKIVEKCRVMKSQGSVKTSLPIFITDPGVQPNSIRRTENNVFIINSISKNFLKKLDILIEKLSG